MIGSCSASKPNFKRRYAKAWKEVLKSEAWKNSLLANNDLVSSPSVGFYTSVDEVMVIDDANLFANDVEAKFLKKYHSLVSRAYVKIIAEAENANDRLKSEYQRWNAKKSDPNIVKNKAFIKQFEIINKRYDAHREMLQGLKSWNIFSEYGTDDLEFFEKENQKEVRSMIENGKGDDAIIGFLVYKLADLYHFET